MEKLKKLNVIACYTEKGKQLEELGKQYSKLNKLVISMEKILKYSGDS